VIPVRRWPLFAVLVLCVGSARWLPWARWFIACAGGVELVACLLLGEWWWALLMGVVLPVGVVSAWAAERAALEIRQLLLEMRREGGETS